MKSNKMPCGCIPGEYLCPVAERYWKTHTAYYNAKLYTLSAEMRNAYDRHMGKKEVNVIVEYTPKQEGSCHV